MRHASVLAWASVAMTLPGTAAPAWAQPINEDLKLLASNGAEEDYFGFSIAIGNGVVAVGSIWADVNGDNSGSAYLFDASTGAQLFNLLPSDGAAGDEFGWSIAIDKGDIAIVGAPRDDDNGTGSGSVYLFDISDPNNPIQIAKLLPSDGAAGDHFGLRIALDNGIVAVGAHFDDDNGSDSGSAYLFDISDQRMTQYRSPNFSQATGRRVTSSARPSPSTTASSR